MNKPSHIGIFDSGIGGLTVAKAICDRLPLESIVYFGDTAHLPYGDKSPNLIQGFSLDITNFLLNQEHCKAIVIACNTASALSYTYLRDKHKGSIPIINVIDPIIESIVIDQDIKKVGLIATQATIESGVYQEKLKRRKPSIQLESLATPMLVPMIEEGYANDAISQALIERYLSNPKFQDIDALILGCTHYVLIKDEINTFFNGKVKLFDSTGILANKLKLILEKEGIAESKKQLNHKFYVSDLTKGFENSASRYFENNIALELKKI